MNRDILSCSNVTNRDVFPPVGNGPCNHAMQCIIHDLVDVRTYQGYEICYVLTLSFLIPPLALCSVKQTRNNGLRNG